jgi:hypothetical protein
MISAAFSGLVGFLIGNLTHVPWWASFFIAPLLTYIVAYSVLDRIQKKRGKKPDMSAYALVDYLIERRYILEDNGRQMGVPTRIGTETVDLLHTPGIDHDEVVINKIDDLIGTGRLQVWARKRMGLRSKPLDPDVMETATIRHWVFQIIFLRDPTYKMRSGEKWDLKTRRPDGLPPEYNSPSLYVDVQFNRREIARLGNLFILDTNGATIYS